MRLNAAGLFLGTGESGQEHGCEDGDDRDDDEQFDESESAASWTSKFLG